ncbi:glycosyltransferase family 2 protein [Desulfonatronum sp. SC1]|uniref:glycosyltransferase family 2 protein n=1 Tax=Desulfonatronum sp. SC1 TaxID=2109626 RepID=UPI000D30989F|nr:glycosyltransferase family 2 protein [Desulfonatronum sp. SC1]PTN35622.1 cellulose synthase catalytic subunit (UDP-forming) [Desulfonatronum sp. SC1]
MKGNLASWWNPLLLIPGVLTLLFAAGVYLPLRDQFILGWSAVLLVIVLRRVSVINEDTKRLLIILVCLLITLRYVSFRVFDTLYYTSPADTMAMGLLFLAECYGIGIYLMGMFVNAMPLKRKIVSVDLDDPDLPTVDVFIPTYNEPLDIVSITATAAVQMNYPKDKLNIYILDDGGSINKRLDPNPKKALQAVKRHEALRSLSRFLEVHYLTRGKNDHAKAGNLNSALQRTSWGMADEPGKVPLLEGRGFGDKGGELVLILDCDHVPSKDFLQNTVGLFMRDKKLFLCQTPHFFINPDPVERNLNIFEQKPAENEMFYGSVLLGLDYWDSAFFCGSAAILRRSYVQEAGGIAGQTITEDAETALGLHARGYSSAYISRPMVCGLSPETFGDLVTQRNRWAQGMVQIFMLKNPLFLKGLKWFQRICYTNSSAFWFFSLSRVVFFLAPILYLGFGLRVYNASLGQVLAFTMPHLFCAIIFTDFLHGKVRHPFFSELYEIVLSLYNLPAMISALIRPKSPSFKVTPKEASLKQDFLSPLAKPFYVILALILLAYPFGLVRWLNHPLELDSILITMAWNTFNLTFVFLCLGIVWERRQIRRKHRMPVQEAALVRILPKSDTAMGLDAPIEVVVHDISGDGLGFLLPMGVAVAVGDRVEFQARDSYGKEHILPLEVVRILSAGKDRLVGCQFQAEDPFSFAKVVSFVYGDSQRWEDFWDKRRERHKTSPWQGLQYLFFIGVSGVVRNFRGIMLLLWSQLCAGAGMLLRRMGMARAR